MIQSETTALLAINLSIPIWSQDNGQRIPSFDRCQVTIKGMSNIKEVSYKPCEAARLCQPISRAMGAILRRSVVVVVRTHTQAILLTVITVRKLIYGFPFRSYMSMVHLLAALGAAGATLTTEAFVHFHPQVSIHVALYFAPLISRSHAPCNVKYPTKPV